MNGSVFYLTAAMSFLIPGVAAVAYAFYHSNGTTTSRKTDYTFFCGLMFMVVGQTLLMQSIQARERESIMNNIKISNPFTPSKGSR